MKKPKDVKNEQALQRKARIPFQRRLAGKVKPSKKGYKRVKRIQPE